jgi:hypothetical protein
MLSHNDKMKKAPVDLDAESDDRCWFMMPKPTCRRRGWTIKLEGEVAPKAMSLHHTMTRPLDSPDRFYFCPLWYKKIAGNFDNGDDGTTCDGHDGGSRSGR